MFLLHPTPKKAGLTALLFILLLFICRFFAPGLIESAYHGTSLGPINALITRQHEYPLAHYLKKFNILFNVLLFFSALLIYAIFAYGLLNNIKKKTRSVPLVKRYGLLLGAAMVLLVAAYLFTILPGGTYINMMTHDMFIYWDGAYRISQGQIPHIDFNTPVGMLAYFLPGLGLAISGQLPGTLEMSNFLVAIGVSAIAVHVLASRYRVLPALITLCYLVLIIIVPMNLGVTDIAHAMFYNRYGWVCLSLLYCFYTEPLEKSQRQFWLDVLSMVCLIAFLFYLKLSYFVFGMAFLVLMTLMSRAKRRLAAYCISLFLAVALTVEWALRGLHSCYLNDIITAIQSSGLVRERRNTLGNVTNELIFAAIGLFFIVKARPLRFYDYCYIALVIVSSLIIINQNYQTTGLVAVIALLLWGHEVASRTNLQTEYRGTLKAQTLSISTVIFALLIFFVGQPLIDRIRGIAKFYAVIAYKPNHLATPVMANLFIGDRISALPFLSAESSPEKLFNDITAVVRAQHLTQGEYIETIELGLALLRPINPTGESIVVFDMANPFSLLLKARPAVGDYSFYHWERNINATTRLPGDILFDSVKFLMIPKIPMTPTNTRFLIKTYEPYINGHFEKAAENWAWVIYRKR